MHVHFVVEIFLSSGKLTLLWFRGPIHVPTSNSQHIQYYLASSSCRHAKAPCQRALILTEAVQECITELRENCRNSWNQSQRERASSCHKPSSGSTTLS